MHKIDCPLSVSAVKYLKERRIRQCKERLDRLLNKEDDLLSISGTTANNTRNDKETFSTPTTLTTTALIELQPSNENTGRYMAIENDNSSTSSSDEILL
ncbi:hypothetical protein COOONC_20728 [Cooperia oncophora]